MVASFPLYDELVRLVEARQEKTIDIQKICKTITNIPQHCSPEEALHHHSIIWILILHHEIINNGGVLLSLIPYEGKVMVPGKGLLYVMMNLPPTLQQIIAQYIEECSKI